jgi:hypothetical protein
MTEEQFEKLMSRILAIQITLGMIQIAVFAMAGFILGKFW